MKNPLSTVLLTLVTGVVGLHGIATPLLAQAGPERWESAVLEFESRDAVDPPPEDAILITGSSSIARWHPSIVSDLAPLTIIPRGFGGSTMEDLLHWVDRLVIAYEPRAVVIYEGDNDTGRGRSAEVIVDQFSEIVDRIHSALPETRIYVLSVKPSVRRWVNWPEAQRVNARFREMAAEDDLLSYIDVATPLLLSTGEVRTDVFVPDNLHFNEEGEDIWAATIRDALLEGELKFEPAGH